VSWHSPHRFSPTSLALAMGSSAAQAICAVHNVSRPVAATPQARLKMEISDMFAMLEILPRYTRKLLSTSGS
jgi:hypothetical protein